MNSPFFHASARFGLGPDPRDMTAMRGDPRLWLTQQIARPVIPPALLAVNDAEEVGQSYQAYFQMKKERKQLKEQGAVELMKKGAQGLRKAYIRQTSQRLLAQVQTSQPFIERLAMFWSNHFTVSIKKPIIAGLVNPFEVEAIRPHLTGRFSDMLIAVAQHPAMLIYLDNVRSVGPNSRRGSRMQKSINENLGREILELHTLGVGSGYTQNDVIALAKIITGWNLERGGEGKFVPRFAFYDVIHEPGPKTLLGRTYNEEGVNEGLRALTDLANHPATARHIASKLAQHFIADEPPPAAVDELTRVYLQTGGHLGTVYNALISMEAAWANPLGKFKTSYEYLVSALRLREISPRPLQIMMALKAVNYIPFSAPSPAGLPDNMTYWTGSDAIMKRIEWAHILSRQVEVRTDSLALAESIFGTSLHAETSKTIAAAASPQDAFAFLIASPEFQRR